MSKLNERLNAIKTGEVKAEFKPSGLVEGDDVKLKGEIKKGKLILEGRLAVVVKDSKKVGKVQCILLDKENQLQGCVITQLADSMTKVGKYTDDGEVILDQASEQEASGRLLIG